jgi:signal transduction histidine kinase
MKDPFELSYYILQSANEYKLKSEFFKTILTHLMEFFHCDAALFLHNDGKKYFLSRNSESKIIPYHFEVFPYPNGKKRIRLIGKFNEISSEKPKWPFSYWTEGGVLVIEHSERFFSSNTKKIKKIITDIHPLNKNFLFLSLGMFEADLNEKGFIFLAGRKPDYFINNKMGSIQGIIKTVNLALINRHNHVALDERLKELSCLYSLVQLYYQPDKTVDEILQGTVELLPPAWQFPELASARIIFDNRVFTSRKFTEGRYCQKSDLIVNGKRRGFIEIIYSKIRPVLNESPFLIEETKLIENISQELSLIIERRLYEEEKAKLMDQLRHTDRLAVIGQLAAAVTHELNEPLANILGFAQLTLKTEGLPEQAIKDIEKILAASLHSREIIRKLLTFARPSPSKKSSVNLNKIILDSLYLFELRCSKEGITLELSLDPALPNIHANPNQLMQVVINLVVNAMQAIPQGGQLTVKTSALGDGISFIVADTGTGIADEIKDKIFTPFFSNKKPSQGTGLGLPIVHEIILEHGGTIQVESKMGQGTLFKMQFPALKLPKAKKVP